MLKQPEYIAKEKISELEDTAIETKQNETQRKENHEPLSLSYGQYQVA